MRLDHLAALIRSKNAGPFQITFDIMFKEAATCQVVKASQVLSSRLIADLYACMRVTSGSSAATTPALSRRRFRAAPPRESSGFGSGRLPAACAPDCCPDPGLTIGPLGIGALARRR